MAEQAVCSMCHHLPGKSPFPEPKSSSSSLYSRAANSCEPPRPGNTPLGFRLQQSLLQVKELPSPSAPSSMVATLLHPSALSSGSPLEWPTGMAMPPGMALSLLEIEPSGLRGPAPTPAVRGSCLGSDGVSVCNSSPLLGELLPKQPSFTFYGECLVSSM